MQDMDSVRYVSVPECQSWIIPLWDERDSDEFNDLANSIRYEGPERFSESGQPLRCRRDTILRRHTSPRTGDAHVDARHTAASNRYYDRGLRVYDGKAWGSAVAANQFTTHGNSGRGI